MDLFYTPSNCIDLTGETLLVEGEEFFHMTKVLRKKEGETVHLTDGAGLSIKAGITKIHRDGLTAAIISVERVAPPPTKVTVAISLLKSAQRFDFFLEKATELGVGGIIPMVTDRTVSLPKAEKVDKKLQRWKRILVSASRQTKRYHLPEITKPLLFSDVLGLEGYDVKLIPYESSDAIPKASFTGKNVLFIVGGEGGFTEEEIRCACKRGFREISFGHSILRAETAGVFAVALVRSQILVNGTPGEWL
ncbi:16S rRNA (uracil(1498)-N(3))-methyltransferase [Prosthecochloris marina]|uniref:Ribosomal RNA small subunit methyltransferase E n=1 Tax=Prosthecochloris marina TaxID=2017681 RepID=A0A317TAS2_9CHLB|nr:16S rRNA (uracil(1498)-N(3))-methyltransferase [Prosthecochloris marina]PWW82967.1 16S rRNA (uracil(1498)-N(3))-methyltransferase [Prosthecochloris marina]